MRELIGAIAWAWIATAHAAPCTDVDKAYARQDAMKQANEARFAKALAARKLKPVKLAQIAMPGNQNGEPPTGFTADRVTETTSKVKVVTGISSTYCRAEPAEFAQDGTKVFRVNRTPKRGAVTTVEVCTCLEPRYVCGGARVVARPVGYVLPANTTFEGVVDIAYVEDAVELAHAAPCPPPGPPPP